MSPPQLAKFDDKYSGAREMISNKTRQFLFTSIVAFGTVFQPASAEPFRPENGAQILERLPMPGDAVTRELRQLRADLSQTPNDLELARTLAKRYINLGRAEADPRYYGYAEAALKP
ncbi:MAG: hypothetical protein HKN28_07685 [Alphaproteobacteria bacterium]|nr:hypothetical protein [Alphaproteobacteria bacterium]